METSGRRPRDKAPGARAGPPRRGGARSRSGKPRRRSFGSRSLASQLTFAGASAVLVAAAFVAVFLLSRESPRKPEDASAGTTQTAVPAAGEAPAQAGDAAAPAAAAPAETGPAKAAPAAAESPPPAQADTPIPPAEGGTPLASARPAGSRPGTALPAPPARPPAPRPMPPTLIFVIDDAGYSMSELRSFLDLPFPLTVAVLPGLPKSAEAARAVRAAGKELILHQPMEARGGQNTGPGAIAAGSTPEEAARILGANLDEFPGAAGVNNHMGSAVTTDPGIMRAVAAVAKARGIYYLDSLTVSGTASAAAARREGIRHWERDVFLDNSPDRASIIRAIDEGKKRAARNRPAVMIGHVWSAELAQALSDLYPQLIAEGYSLSTISRYMLEEAAADDAGTRD